MKRVKNKQIKDYSVTQDKFNLETPLSAQTSLVATVEYVKQVSGVTAVYSDSNLNMAGLVTTSDGDLACNTAIIDSPTSIVNVYINGLIVDVGNGVNDMCYFSNDSGITKRAKGTEQQGDYLYWLGSVAEYQLDTTDEIDFIYLKEI
jgi:hypothetical protein